LYDETSIKGLWMKKVIGGAIIAACILMPSSLTASTDMQNGDKIRAYDMGVMLGATSVKNDGGVELKNGTFGVNFQINKYSVKPRFDFEYVRVTDKDKLISGLKAD